MVVTIAITYQMLYNAPSVLKETLACEGPLKGSCEISIPCLVI